MFLNIDIGEDELFVVVEVFYYCICKVRSEVIVRKKGKRVK